MNFSTDMTYQILNHADTENPIDQWQAQDWIVIKSRPQRKMLPSSLYKASSPSCWLGKGHRKGATGQNPTNPDTKVLNKLWIGPIAHQKDYTPWWSGFIPVPPGCVNICKSTAVLHHMNRTKDKTHMITPTDAEKAFDKFQQFMI